MMRADPGRFQLQGVRSGSGTRVSKAGESKQMEVRISAAACMVAVVGALVPNAAPGHLTRAWRCGGAPGLAPRAVRAKRTALASAQMLLPFALPFGGPADGAVLTDTERAKDNQAPDMFYYDYPRLCYHADAEWHAELTKVYAERLPYGDECHVADLMTYVVSACRAYLDFTRACSLSHAHCPRPLSRSWVSHYPRDGRRWGRVTGLGMNEEELAKNPQLDFFQVSKRGGRGEERGK